MLTGCVIKISDFHLSSVSLRQLYGLSKRNVKGLKKRRGPNGLSDPGCDRLWLGKTKGISLTAGIHQRRGS